MVGSSLSRKMGVAGTVFAGLLLVATAASAHVEITPNGSASPDGVLQTSIVAENECSGAIATVDLVFPDTPEITTATPSDVPRLTSGWTNVVTTRTGSEAVANVTWTNAANAEGDGSFDLAIGPIATDQDPIEFKAIVTCVDGKVFRWIEAGEDSEFPAPVLTIAKSSTATTDHAHDEATTDTKAPASTTKKDSGSSTGVIVAIVAGAVVLIGGGIVLMRRKK